MKSIERKALNKIVESLKERFPERIREVYAFGSRVRGDYTAWSDFDVLIVVKDKDPSIEEEIVGLFVDEELEIGVPFAPLIKDQRAFEKERAFKTPFYTNILNEGISLL